MQSAGHELCGSVNDTEAHYGMLLHPAALEVVKAGVPWVGRYLSPQSGPSIAAYTPIPQLGWGILVETPERKLLASIERLKWQALGVGLVFVAFMVPAMFATARATARPLHTLAEAARRVAEGGPGDRVRAPESPSGRK